MNRKQQLKNRTFGKLQSTEEFKHFCDTYLDVWLMNEEVEYILKQSLEDSEAPFSYEDFDQYDRTNFKEECINKIIEELNNLDDEEQKELFNETNKENNLKIKTNGDYEVYLNALGNEEIQKLAEDTFNLYEDDYLNYTEVMQWFYICDDRIIDQLEDRGEVILNNKFWGRQAFGQSITMDSVIIDIFKEWYLELYGLPFNINKEVEEWK